MKRTILHPKWFIGGMCVVLALLLLGGQVRAVRAAEEEKPVIRVGYTDKGQMIKKNGEKFYGYGVAYLQILAAYTGWQYEYVLVPEETRMEELIGGTIQLLCDVSLDEAGSEHLLLSQESSGLSYALLCAKEDDTSVFFDEYRAMDGKRIAINRSRRMERMMETFAEEHGFAYTPVYCDSISEMEAAVEEGKADLLVASNQRELSGYKYVAKIGLRDQYFAVAPGQEALMKQIDDADRQLKINQPFITASLYETFYGRPSQLLTGITREEYAFIHSGNPVRVACDANSFPVEYIDEKTGEYKGIYADALELIREESGLEFEFVPIQEYKDVWNLLKDGEVDMSAGMYVNDALKQEYGILASDSHITATYTLIARVDKTLRDAMTVALPENYIGIQAYIREHFPKWEIVSCKDTGECLELTETGAVDGTLINAVFLQTVYNLNHYSHLIVLPMHSVDIPISCGFAGTHAELLCSLMNKVIHRIPKEAFANCTVENAVKVAYEPTVQDMLRKLSPYLFFVVVLFALLYLVTLWLRERHYRYLAMTDTLTGLWNGRCFRQKAGERLAHADQKKYQLISFDLEHFKYINNDFGEKAADSILKNVAERMRAQMGKDALYAREMGDMFLILTEARDDMEAALHALGGDISFENNGMVQHYRPDMKFGICNIEKEGRRLPVNEYIDRAIAARKTIKRVPEQEIACFDGKMAETISQEAWIEKKMEAALRQREFVVYYQPKYSLDSEQITGAEALVRWKSPEEGLLFPNAFIPIFERNGFIVQLDFYVYEEALKTLAKWRDEGRREIVISVNVSRAHVGTGDFLEKLTALADRYQVPHRLLELELTETVLGGKHQDMLEFIRACKEAGFPISIDDFGSGYSSLNLLKELPVDVLKIDREFLNETEVSQKSRIIIEQIVKMAAKIRIQTLCEGVETREQAEFLRKIGCNMAQGYLYAKPVPLEEFETL